MMYRIAQWAVVLTLAVGFLIALHAAWVSVDRPQSWGAAAVVPGTCLLICVTLVVLAKYDMSLDRDRNVIEDALGLGVFAITCGAAIGAFAGLFARFIVVMALSFAAFVGGLIQ